MLCTHCESIMDGMGGGDYRCLKCNHDEYSESMDEVHRRLKWETEVLAKRKEKLQKLKFAAKAMGYSDVREATESWSYFALTPDGWTNWNPIDNDGDALRLAVKLGFQFGLTVDTGGMAHWGPITYTDYKMINGKEYKYSGPYETHGNDAFAATRLAIFNAAVEIGEKL